jgi:hypothetical protein
MSSSADIYSGGRQTLPIKGVIIKTIPTLTKKSYVKRQILSFTSPNDTQL